MKKTLLILFLTAAMNLNAFEVFNLYAPPLTWSPWYTVGSYFTEEGIKYTVEAVPAGDGTLLHAQVSFFSNEGEKIIDFTGGTSVTFTVCDNCAANIKVRFKGNPLGTGVKVSVTP